MTTPICADMSAVCSGDNYEVRAVVEWDRSPGRNSPPSSRPGSHRCHDARPGWVRLLHEIRADRVTKTIPVILLSARAGEDARIEGMQAGADDYMVKPFTARELLARVGAHLAMGRLRRESADHERALRAEAEETAAALEQARKELETRVQERTGELQVANEELRELSSRLQQLQDEERRRIARDLHDSAGQLLAAIAMNFAVVETESQKLSPSVARCVEDNRELVEQLRPKFARFRIFCIRRCLTKSVSLRRFAGTSTDSHNEAAFPQPSICRRTWNGSPTTQRSRFFARFRNA